MRVLELTAHVKTISRAKGRSATAAAAYRACALIACEREGRVHDYRRKQGLVASAIVTPDAAPSWMQDRARLWNAAELRERNGARGLNAGAWKATATVAREVLFGLPDELSPSGRLALAHAVARHLVAAHGVAIDFSIHQPGEMGDQRNHHCHLLMTTRRATADGLTEKAREWDGRPTGSRTVLAFRAWLAGAMNAALAAEGHGGTVHVEHRSFEARGIAKAPGKHMGVRRTNAARRRRLREREAWERDTRRQQAEQHGRERTDQATEREARAAARHRDIDARERRAIEQARAAQARTMQPAEPSPQPGRLTRIFRAMTGRADHAPEPAAPARAEQERTVGEVRATFQAERDRTAADHQRDAKTLDDRHRAEDRQLDRAATARADRDRVEEAMQRRDYAEGRARIHDHERGRDDREHDRQFRP